MSSRAQPVPGSACGVGVRTATVIGNTLTYGTLYCRVHCTSAPAAPLLCKLHVATGSITTVDVRSGPF